MTYNAHIEDNCPFDMQRKDKLQDEIPAIASGAGRSVSYFKGSCWYFLLLGFFGFVSLLLLFISGQRNST